MITLYNYANQQTLKITDNSTEKKHDLTHIEKRALMGYLFDIFNNNYEIFSEIGIQSVGVLYDNCMIQNDELRFFCGEGIELGDGCRLDSIFFNKFGVCCFSVYDNNDNEIILA